MEPASQYKNTVGHPIYLDDGTQVPPGAFTKGPFDGPVAQSEIEAGHLVPKAEPTQKRSSSSGKSGGDE